VHGDTHGAERAVVTQAGRRVWLPERRSAIRSICSSSRPWVPGAGGDRRRGRAPLAATSCPLSGADPAALRASVSHRRRIRTTSTACCRPRTLPNPCGSPARPSFSITTDSRASCPCDRRGVVAERLVSSYRLDNGVCTTPSTIAADPGRVHVAEGGLPIPATRRACRSGTYLASFQEALRPPAQLTRLPFTANWPAPVETMVSLLLRPRVSRRSQGGAEKRWKCASSLPAGWWRTGLRESIFGNAGDPYHAGNDPRSTSTAGPATAAA